MKTAASDSRDIALKSAGKAYKFAEGESLDRTRTLL